MVSFKHLFGTFFRQKLKYFWISLISLLIVQVIQVFVEQAKFRWLTEQIKSGQNITTSGFDYSWVLTLLIVIIVLLVPIKQELLWKSNGFMDLYRNNELSFRKLFWSNFLSSMLMGLILSIVSFLASMVTYLMMNVSIVPNQMNFVHYLFNNQNDLLGLGIVFIISFVIIFILATIIGGLLSSFFVLFVHMLGWNLRRKCNWHFKPRGKIIYYTVFSIIAALIYAIISGISGVILLFMPLINGKFEMLQVMTIVVLLLILILVISLSIHMLKKYLRTYTIVDEIER